MNKCQESLDFIVKNSCPSHMSCKECHMNKICNNLVKSHIDRIQELIDEHKQLEKALDKACEELASLSYKINMMENPMAYDAEYMKEEE